jgi:UPF0716 family protein affecting phage T7 exclusion
MPKEALQAIKFWGTALIIAGAALIMLPGLLTYFMGLSRILLIVIITLVIATIAGNIIFRLRRRPVQSKVSAKESVNESANSLPKSQTDSDVSANQPEPSDALQD